MTFTDILDVDDILAVMTGLLALLETQTCRNFCHLDIKLFYTVFQKNAHLFVFTVASTNVNQLP